MKDLADQPYWLLHYCGEHELWAHLCSEDSVTLTGQEEFLHQHTV